MIELFHVVKSYNDTDRPALDDVSVRIEKGEFCILTGPSGAGKSTLLRLLFLAETATRGQVLLNGRNLASIKHNQVPYLRRNVGVIFQDFKLLPHYTTFQNVALALEVQGKSREIVQQRCEKIIRDVGLQAKLHSPCENLSGGEKQRVAIARALVTDPAILLADEPTGNLDPERSSAIWDLLLRANARGTTVLVATHDPILVEKSAKRVLTLDQGKFVHRGLR